MKKYMLFFVILLHLGCVTQNKDKVLPKYQKWHTITLSFDGEETSETDEINPFLNYKLVVNFTHKESQYAIRGFYAADGSAAETSADSGSV